MVSPKVYVVDDERSVRDSITWILGQDHIDAVAFATPNELWSASHANMHGCLVIDLRLPEMNGLELQRRLVQKGCQLPFIVISGHGEVKDVAEAMRQGAFDFIEKPLNRGLFIERVRQAMELDHHRRKRKTIHDEIQARLRSLTPRERQVLDLVVEGKLTKQISVQLGISTKTVEVHRYNVTRKMKVESVAKLFRLIMVYELTGTGQSELWNSRFDKWYSELPNNN